jgi:L-alanine-DL-glutamate epimerase-like enolase superfamily enzyme
MNICGVRIYRQFQPFVEGPYVCREHSEDGFDSAIVALHSSEGTVGWGEAAPLGAFYAEGFSESIIAGLMVLAPKLLSCPTDAPAQVKATLDDAMLGNTQ